MELEKVDYAGIARDYDRVRSPNNPHVQWWVTRLTDAGALASGKQLLDLGCGTGRWSLLLAERTGCRCIGVDNSPEMLARAKEKDEAGRCEWCFGEAVAPPVPPESCDVVLMSLLLHFTEDVPAVFRAALPCLCPGGILLVRQPTLEQLADDPIHRFFPESLAIERRRTPLRREIEFWLEEAGFTSILVEPVHMRCYHSLDAWFEEIRLRVASIFRLLPDDVFQRGLERCRQYVREHPDDVAFLENDAMTLFVARKPCFRSS
jgi:ubiquinone/menaquinone biosynthesis C-methylase UbiE